MNKLKSLKTLLRLGYQALIANLQRRGTPQVVFHMELFQDVEIRNTVDTAILSRDGGRTYMDDFESYPWPDPLKPEATASLEWFQRNLEQYLASDRPRARAAQDDVGAHT